MKIYEEYAKTSGANCTIIDNYIQEIDPIQF